MPASRRPGPSRRPTSASSREITTGKLSPMSTSKMSRGGFVPLLLVRPQSVSEAIRRAELPLSSSSTVRRLSVCSLSVASILLPTPKALLAADDNLPPHVPSWINQHLEAGRN